MLPVESDSCGAGESTDPVVLGPVVFVDGPGAPTLFALVREEPFPFSDDVPVVGVPLGLAGGSLSSVWQRHSGGGGLPAEEPFRGHPERQAGFYVVAGCPEVVWLKGTAAPVM